jgi:restriction system protein
MWMVRAGEHGFRFEDFERTGIVAIGWPEMGDLRELKSRDDFRRAAVKAFPEMRKLQAAVSAGQTFRFVREMSEGDGVVTYSPSDRRYLVGTLTGEHYYEPAADPEQPNGRKVQWRGSVFRDQLSVATRNSLGAISTLFLLPDDAAAEIERLISPAGQRSSATGDESKSSVAEVQQVEDLYKDVQARGFEFIKDKVSKLEWDEMQELVAGLLRAMGYKTRVSPSGSDRGKDIVASRDGLGFEDPRIVVEVKHRTGSQMGSQEIRSFLGGRHESDKGLYVSTGGFTREARYEAERGRIPVTLMDIDDLVSSLLEHYEKLDTETQRLLPLRKIYWPT